MKLWQNSHEEGRGVAVFLLSIKLVSLSHKPTSSLLPSDVGVTDVLIPLKIRGCKNAKKWWDICSSVTSGLTREFKGRLVTAVKALAGFHLGKGNAESRFPSFTTVNWWHLLRYLTTRRVLWMEWSQPSCDQKGLPGLQSDSKSQFYTAGQCALTLS